MEKTFRKLKLSMEDLPEAYTKTIGDFLLEKLHKLIRLLGDLFTIFRRKADEIFPPETRAETLSRGIHVFLTVVLPVSLVFLCLYCCCFRRRGCCCGCFRRRGCFCGCFRRRGCCCGCFRRWFSGDRMMRAPGRPGRYMPRSSFEADPRNYFANLHAKKDLLF
ncbi:hypothetical protein KSP39_PZI012076 [Platanthera zijinensis]|uniref:Uncharacterized protein n=1 Tax=Platanthera zijinensis TaxID=2320716 RepID=A0AAP0G4E1_9ASPA